MLTFDLQKFAATEVVMTNSLAGTSYAYGALNATKTNWAENGSTVLSAAVSAGSSFYAKYTYGAAAGTAIVAKDATLSVKSLATPTWVKAGSASHFGSLTAIKSGTGSFIMNTSTFEMKVGSSALLLNTDGGLYGVKGDVAVTKVGASGVTFTEFSNDGSNRSGDALAGSGSLAIMSTDFTLKNATGKLTLSNNVYTYEASGKADQYVKVGTGNANFAFKMGDGNDTIITGSATTSVSGGKGDDVILLENHKALGNGFSIVGGEGNDTIMTVATGGTSFAQYGAAALVGAYIDGGAADDAIALQDVRRSTITGGNGADQIVVAKGTSNGNNTITGGAGSDTITTDDATNVIYGNGGGSGDKNVDYFDARSTNISSTIGSSMSNAPALNIADYESGYDVILVDSVETVLSAAANGSLSGGVLKLDSATVTIGSTTGATSAIFEDNDGNSRTISWTGSSSGSTDYSSATTPQLILATSTTSPYIGGSANDTIIAQSDNISMYGAGGNDSLVVSGYNRAWVGVATNSGADTVVGFNDTAAGITSGFDGTLADQVSLVSGAASQVSASYNSTTGDLTLADGSTARLTLASLTGSASDQTSTTGAIEVMINNAKVAVAAVANGTISATSADYADYYLGNGTGALSFETVEGSVGVNMEQGFMKGDAKYDADHFRDFATLVGGSVESTLVGATNADTTIQTTAGKSSVWGGNGGQNMIISTQASKDEIFMLTGSGRDTVTGFTTYTATDPEHADVLNVLGSGFQAVHLTSNGVLADITDKDNILIQTGSTMTCNDMIAWRAGDSTTGGIAKVGYENVANNFEFNTAVTQYIGGAQVDSLTMTSDALDHFVWLDGDNFEQARGVGYAGIDIVDATQTTGNLQLAGDKTQNTLIGGTGNASMWGGSSDAADVLVAGLSVNTFFYGMGDGNDTITGVDGGDLINLMNIDETSIDATQTANALDAGSNTIYFTNGQALSVGVTGDGIANFQLGNGNMYQLSGGKLTRTK